LEHVAAIPHPVDAVEPQLLLVFDAFRHAPDNQMACTVVADVGGPQPDARALVLVRVVNLSDVVLCNAAL
jgi:hypothetical protein